jgi:PhnB protein
MSLDIYLNFAGNCREVVLYYVEVFGLEQPHIMTFGEMEPDPSHPIPDEAKSLIMHSRISIGGSTLMLSDTFPGMPFTQGNNFSLSLTLTSADELKSAFEKLKDGGKVIMELGPTFWSELYGSVVDKFGIQWQFNLEK